MVVVGGVRKPLPFGGVFADGRGYGDRSAFSYVVIVSSRNGIWFGLRHVVVGSGADVGGSLGEEQRIGVGIVVFLSGLHPS